MRYSTLFAALAGCFLTCSTTTAQQIDYDLFGQRLSDVEAKVTAIENRLTALESRCNCGKTAAAPQTTNGRQILFFTTEGCGPCVVMSSRLDGVPHQKIDGGENPQLASQYGVEVYPTFVLVENGKWLKKTSGVVPASLLRQWLSGETVTTSTPPSIPGTRFHYQPSQGVDRIYRGLHSSSSGFTQPRDVRVATPVTSSFCPSCVRQPR